ncbi:MAG: DedA family protein [Deltaproteobacteria bacterium]|nr:DedA family protein [Deltaproteobacteria bacterium]
MLRGPPPPPEGAPTLHAAIEFLKSLTRPDSLAAMAQALGFKLYLILFAIIFAETGLVMAPFLPGDSLLFTIGAVSATGGLSLAVVIPLLVTAAVVGDAVNYAVGYRLGPAVFSRDDSWLLNKKHLEKTQRFYAKYGGKTIIMARFVPIVRTFAPFVAGIGKMSYPRFLSYNIVGAFAWVVLCSVAGHEFGQLEFVRKHFELVLVAIIIISILPGVIEFLRERRASAREGAAG